MSFKLPTNLSSNRVTVPEVRFSDNGKLEIEGSAFQARAKSLQARVLEYFFSSPNGLLKRTDLLGLLYEPDLEPSIHTIRYEGSKWGSGHKVMSRLRKSLNEKFAHRVPPGTEWLPFSHILDGWILFKLPGYGSDGGWHN